MPTGHFERTKEHCERIGRALKKRYAEDDALRECLSRSKRGKNNPNFGKHAHNYKGGFIRKDGYKVLTFIHESKKITVLEHRIVIEKAIGRPLKSYEQGHHRNGNRADNKKKNLMAFCSISAHRRFELNGFCKPKEIIFDGKKS